jgi:hypothetical protein
MDNKKAGKIAELIKNGDGSFALFAVGDGVKVYKSSERDEYYCIDERAAESKCIAVNYMLSVVKSKWDAWELSPDEVDFISDSIAFSEISGEHEVDGITYKAWFEIVD